MDETDVLVFRSLHQGELGDPLSTDPRKSLREVARRLGIDELTVRGRLDKLQRQGFLKRWQMFVNPALLGADLVQVLFDYDERDPERIVGRLRSLPEVTAIVNHIGKSMWVVIVCDDGRLTRCVARAEDAVGRKPSALLKIPFPPCKVKLSPTDAEIITALSADPRKLYSDVAEELGYSARTVRRRLGRLVEERALFVIPAMDPGALEGALMADLLVKYSSPANLSKVNRELLSRLDKHLVRAQLGDRGYAFFNLFITKVSAADEILRGVRSIDGVEAARIDLVRNRVELFEHYYGGHRGLGRFTKP